VNVESSVRAFEKGSPSDKMQARSLAAGIDILVDVSFLNSLDVRNMGLKMIFVELYNQELTEHLKAGWKKAGADIEDICKAVPELVRLSSTRRSRRWQAEQPLLRMAC